MLETFLHSNVFLLMILIINCLILALYILNNLKLKKLRKNYSDFMSKLGNGSNIYDMLQKYVEEVESLNIESKELKKYCDRLDHKSDLCIHKVGMVRYNAYKDTGSNLSFALVLLNEENDGVVLNGIYSRDTSNIYCKTIKGGNPEYALSKEEQEALDKVLNEENNKK